MTLALLPTLLACKAPELVDTPTSQDFVLGEDDGKGNVVAVQAWMDPSAYATEENFAERLDEYLYNAKNKGWLFDNTIVVLPEHIATWLVVIDEANGVIEADTAEQALKRMVPAHLGEFLSLRQGAPAEDAEQYALFALKAEQVAEVWQRVSRELAREYNVTLVAGSAWLPGPRLVDGELHVTVGAEMRNVSMVLGPDGEVVGDLIMKAFPTSDEQNLVTAVEAKELTTAPTTVGEVAVLLGEDSWYPEAWSAVRDSTPVVAVAPHWTSPNGAWNDLWGGYSGFEAPNDVPLEDEREMIYSDAILEYGLPGRAFDYVVREGVTVPLRGELWDLGTDGAIIGVYRKEATVGPLVNAPVLLNLWLPKR